MYAQKCLTMTPAADARCQVLLATATRKAFRFSASSATQCSFEPLDDYRVKDYVVQPPIGGALAKTVVMFDESSMKKGYGKDIDWDGAHWVFQQSERRMPTEDELKAMAKAVLDKKKEARKAAGVQPKKTKATASKEDKLATDTATVKPTRKPRATPAQSE